MAIKHLLVSDHS